MSGSMSTRELPLTVSLAILSIRHPGFEMRRTVSEGMNREAESHMEEYRVRRPSDVSSKMPSVMSSEVVLLRFMSVGKVSRES